MRILALMDYLASGGTEWQLTYTVPELARRGVKVEVAVLFPVPEGGERTELVARLTAAGAAVHLLDLERRWDLVRNARKVARLIRSARPDLLHARHYFSGLLAAASRVASRGTPRLVSFHNLAYEFETSWKSQGRKALDRVAMHTAIDAFAAVSHATADSYRRHLRLPHVEVVPNAVPIEEILRVVASPDPDLFARYGLDPDEPFVLVPARQVAVKGHRYLVRAVAELGADARLPRLLLVGRGPEAERTRAQISSLGLASRILLHAEDAPHDDVLRLMASAELVVLPSTHEGFPNVAGEAMAAGAPFLGTTVGGLPDLVQPEVSGILVPPADPTALAAALRRLLPDAALRARLAEAGRARVRDAFSVTSVVDRWIQLYRRVAG